MLFCIRHLNVKSQSFYAVFAHSILSMDTSERKFISALLMAYLKIHVNFKLMCLIFPSLDLDN